MSADESHTIFPRIQTYRSPEGLPLAVRVWQPATEPIAQMVFLHGVISHSGWYSSSCAYLAAQGVAVHFLDRRGSGLNVKSRGDVNRWTTWTLDVESYLENLDRAPPRILGGISWGGKLAAAVARRRADLVDGLALVCPGIYAFQQPSRWKRLAVACADSLSLSRLRVKIPLDDPSLFTDAPRHREYVGNDPLSIRRVTVRFAREDQRLTEFAREAGPHLEIPLLLVLAGRDRIVANEQMESFLANAASRDNTLRKYPRAAHTLEFESDPRPYFADLSEWIHAVARRAKV